MKTLDFVIKNLGPVKDATFTASNLNVLCGKNNSGKSFILHTIYLFLSKWRYQLGVRINIEHERELAVKGCVKFNVRDYLPFLNEWLSRSTADFVKNLPGMMKKDSACFTNCSFEVKVDLDYARTLANKQFVEFETELVKGCVLKVSKPSDSLEVDVSLVNTAKEFPAPSVVQLALRLAVMFTVVDVLPRPVLLTAERVGTMLYGDDINAVSNPVAGGAEGAAYSSLTDKNIREHYPVANLSEIEMLVDMRRSTHEQTWYLQNRQEFKDVYRRFCELVAGGTYSENKGKLYFADKAGTFRVEDASTSVKSLLFIDDYIKARLRPGSLLMIDEPELNLHLEKQRALVRVLAQIVNKTGTGVAISTHSECIVRELNTLIAFGSNISRYGEVMAKHGYNPDECVSSDCIACGVVENGGVEQMPVSPQGGFFIQSFDRTTEEITRIQLDIVRLWESA